MILDSPTISKGVNLNLEDFELDNNLDPFSNCELNTIDDKKILLDVFKTTVLTSNTTTSTSSKNSKLKVYLLLQIYKSMLKAIGGGKPCF